MATNGWKLNRDERAALLEGLPADYGGTVADHVMLAAHLPEDADLSTATRGEIVGAAGDARGGQAMVVAIDGTTHRSDGGTYHVTWSLGAGGGRSRATR